MKYKINMIMDVDGAEGLNNEEATGVKEERYNAFWNRVAHSPNSSIVGSIMEALESEPDLNVVIASLVIQWNLMRRMNAEDELKSSLAYLHEEIQ
jgi:hypothetical protein